jgi:hypothetical protein
LPHGNIFHGLCIGLLALPVVQIQIHFSAGTIPDIQREKGSTWLDEYIFDFH